jgi:ribokinase
VVGSINADFIVRVTALPLPGETLLGGDLVVMPGGKGANQAIAAAHLGAPVSFFGAVGTDANAAWLTAHLEKYGVNIEGLATLEGASGTAMITVDDKGENTIVVSPAANGKYRADASALRDFDILITQLEMDPSVLEVALDSGVPVVLNVSPPRPTPAVLLERCAVVVVNEGEAKALDIGGQPLAIVTLGAKGAVAYEYGREITSVEPPRVDALDTVGAGDAFCAAFALAYAKELPLRDALNYAVTAGAIATLGSGAHGSLPTDEEVHEWLARG